MCVRPLSRLERGHPSPYSTPLGTDPPSALAMRPPRSPARSTPMLFSIISNAILKQFTASTSCCDNKLLHRIDSPQSARLLAEEMWCDYGSSSVSRVLQPGRRRCCDFLHYSQYLITSVLLPHNGTCMSLCSYVKLLTSAKHTVHYIKIQPAAQGLQLAAQLYKHFLCDRYINLVA